MSFDTLNQLYSQGILNYTPIELLDASPAPIEYENPYKNIKAQALNAPEGYAYRPYAKYKKIGGPTYLDKAMGGNLYKNSNRDDSFTYNVNTLANAYAFDDNYGSGMDLEEVAYGEEGKEIRQALTKGARNVKEKLEHKNVYCNME